MKYYIALFQKIKDYYKTQSTNPSELALICPSLRVYDDKEMKLLLPQILIDDALKGEALIKKQDISFQLNSIPSSDKFWDINPSNTLFDAYDKIINVDQEIQNFIDPAEFSEAQKVIYDDKGKPTKEKKAYDKYLGLFDKLLTEWEEHVSKYNSLTTDNEKQIWLEKLNTILLRKEKLIIDHKLLGYKDVIEKAMAKINKTDGFDVFLSNLINSRNVLENSKKTGILSLESYYDINFVPYDFMSNNNGWTKLTIDKKELDELYEVAKIQKDEFSKEIIAIDYDEKNIMGIELEFSIVTMQRNWFSIASLVSNFFKWNEAKSISDGETISNDFLLPAFPKRMILIKNLKINIDEAIASTDVSNINQLIYFGPIVMKNQLFVNSHTNTKFIKAIRNKETLTSNNLKYYNTKLDVKKSIATNPSITMASAISPPITMASSASMRPMMRASTMKPLSATAEPIKTIHHLQLNPVLFQPVTIIQTDNKLVTIILNIKDAITKSVIYQSEISITGTNNTVFKEIESDRDGSTNLQLPIGNYTIEIRKNGYSLFRSSVKIENTNPLVKDFYLDPESVTYDSFFLIGMICEKLPKIPK